MQIQIIRLTDTNCQANASKFYALKNKDWSFDKLRNRFIELHPEIKIREDWRGYYYEFKEFIEARGAVEIQPSYY